MTMNRKRKKLVKYRNSLERFKQNSHKKKIRGKLESSVKCLKCKFKRLCLLDLILYIKCVSPKYF